MNKIKGLWMLVALTLLSAAIFYRSLFLSSSKLNSTEKLHVLHLSNMSTDHGRLEQVVKTEHTTFTSGTLEQDLIEEFHSGNKVTTSADLALGCTMKSEFTFPQPLAFKSKDEIVSKEWYKDLQIICSQWTSQYVFFVSSNADYKEVLMNWLVSAVIHSKVQLNKIIVITFNRDLNNILVSRQIQSLFIPFQDILAQNLVARAPAFTQIMMTRLAVIRLLNHWGMDVINLDIDAILIKDPEPLFTSLNNSEIVGSIGKFPADLKREWGVTMCSGVVLIRSAPNTETFWTRLGKTLPQSFSDQGRLNYGLKNLHIHWKSFDRARVNTSPSPVEGVCENGLKVTLLPQTIICRNQCNSLRRSTYTVWHNGGAKNGHGKKMNAQSGHMWFLINRWERKCERIMIAYEWLQCISGT